MCRTALTVPRNVAEAGRVALLEGKLGSSLCAAEVKHTGTAGSFRYYLMRTLGVPSFLALLLAETIHSGLALAQTPQEQGGGAFSA